MDVIDNAIDAVMDRFSNDPSSVQSEVTLHTSPLMIPTGWQGTVNHLVEQQPTIWIHTRSQADQVLVEIVDMALGFRLKFNLISLNHSSPQKEWVREQGLDSIPVTKSLNGRDIRVMARPGDTCFQVRLPSQS